MIDYQNMRRTVVQGLTQYLGCPVVRSNQAAEAPAYPYVTYTVTMLMSENKGTYGEYDDGISRKPVNTIWSITAQSDDNLESVTLAMKAREWLEKAGKVYLNDNNVIVQSITSVTNRDNVISVGYEHKNGFDVTFWGFDEVDCDIETIETAIIENNRTIEN